MFTRALVVMVLLAGSATAHPQGSLLSGYGHHSPAPAFLSDSGETTRQEMLVAFLACASPAEFVALQRGVDMARLVEGLDDASAVRLGALGPLPADAAEVLNRKRASLLLQTTRDHGLARAEVFALFILHSSFDDDLRQVLRLLAQDKQLGETLGKMGFVREALARRGLTLSDSPDRPERLGDVARGLARAADEALSTSELRRGALALKYQTQKAQLPPPYQDALDEVEQAEMRQAFSPGNMALRSFDSLTFGVPLGFYALANGTGQGLHSLSRGQYEQATRELAPAALMVALYVGGRFRMPEPRIQVLKEAAAQLGEDLGANALGDVARYIQARREAADFVAVGGVDAATALLETRGDVARAHVWLSQTKPQRAGATTPTKAVARNSPAGFASMVDEAVGLSREVVEARLTQVELDSTGPRLSGNVALLEKQHPSLSALASEAQGHPLWSEYVVYWENRLAELKQGKAVKPPLVWAGYEQMRGLFARGLAFERTMVSLLRADAALPKAQRRFLKDFTAPRIETYVGVAKPGTPGIRFADVLVIENQLPSGRPPLVETFSFKSRNLLHLALEDLTAQMKVDASEALLYYGEMLDIRRPSLKLRDRLVRVHRVHLIYEGGALKPKNPEVLRKAMSEVQENVEGVEVRIE